jgi:ADP-heptose:LPS heptosyltransferase
MAQVEPHHLLGSGARPDGPTSLDRPTTPATLRPLHPAPRRVAVFRALQLGDLLCAVPALRALRGGLPDARITLIGLPWARVLPGRFPDLLDDVIPFPGHPALPEQPVRRGEWESFPARVRAERFDLLLQLHGDGSVTNGIVGTLGARELAGFALEPAASPAPDRFLRYPSELHEVHRCLALVRALGMPDAGDALAFPVTEADRAELAALPEVSVLRSRSAVVVHPGSRSADRRWAPERFAAVADALAADGHAIVVTGTDDERPITAAVIDAMRHSPIDLTGRTGLGSLAALLADAALLVANDTGVAHLAAAIGTPSVVLFSASDPARWAPLDRARHVVIRASQPEAPAQVLAAARRQLVGDARRVA